MIFGSGSTTNLKEMRQMKHTLWVAALSVALSPLAASAQEYVVKVKHPGLGDKTQAKVNSTFEIEFKILDNGGNVVQDAKELKTTKFVYREVGLERVATGEDLVKVKRQYEHAERKVKEERHTLPYQGKTLLIEKKDSKFEFQIEGGDLVEGKEAEELNEEFNKGGLRKLFTDHFLPRKAVQLNEVWKYDVAPLAKAFSADGKITIDEAKSTGSGKLLKAYMKNGKQFGLIVLSIDMPVTHFTGDDNNKSPTKDSKIHIQLELDGCIDGTVDVSRVHAKINGDVRATINANGMDLGIAITLRATADELRTPVTK